MPVYLDKKTKRFYIEFQYRGERHKERMPAGVSKKDAERIEVKMKNDLMFQSHGIESGSAPITFERFIDEYFGQYADTHYSPDSFDKAVHIAKAAKPFFKGKAMRQIKAADIERFKAYRIALPTMHKKPRKPATVEREMSIISRIFSIAVRNDIIDYNPCSRVEKLKFDNVQDKLLRREDEEAFFANIHGEWTRDICLMVLNTGMRQNDLMGLTRFQVDRANRVITLVQGKTQRRVVIPMNETVCEIIDRRWHGRNPLLFPSPVTGTEKGSVRHTMRRACERAKIPVLSIRDLRRTFATRGIEAGNDSVTVADSLGHSSMRMIQRYVRSLENKRKLVESIANPPKIRQLSKKQG